MRRPVRPLWRRVQLLCKDVAVTASFAAGAAWLVLVRPETAGAVTVGATALAAACWIGSGE